MLEFLIIVLSFSAGFLAGSYFKAFVLGTQNWIVMKWNPDIFGYRKVPSGYKIQKNEDVFMCLEMDTSDISEDGLEVSQ